jgi:hypothetical protein
MVDLTNGITGMLPKVSSASLINGLMIFCIGLIILGILGYIAVWFFRKRKYKEYRIVIWEKDSTGNTHEFYDRGGVFVDKKTGFKLLFLERLKKGLNPNNVPFVSSKDKKGRLVKTVYLRKIGVSNYVFCHVKISDTGVAFTVGEEDVNWAAQDIERVRRSFLKEGFLSKFAPYIMFIVTILIVMIILISLFNKMGVVQEASENLLKVAELNHMTTELLFNLTNRTDQFQQTIPVIVSGGG